LNPVANLYITIAISSLCVGLFVYFNSSKKKLAKLFLLFTIAGFYWGFSGFLLRDASSFQQALLMQKIGGFWPFCIAIFAHFAFFYIKIDKFFKNKILFYTVLYAPAVFFSFFEITTNEITVITKSSLGFWTSSFPEDSILYISSTVWSWSISTIAIFFVLLYLIKEKPSRKKNQTKFVFIGLCTPFLLSTITESIIPMTSLPLFKMTVPGFGLGLIFIAYAIYKYELFEINPTIAADEIISTMQDYLILTDQNKKIQTVNPSILKTTNYKTNELVGKDINLLFSEDHINNNQNTNFFDLNNKDTHAKINLITKNDEKIPVVFSKTVFVDEYQNVKGLIVLGHDLSEEAKAEQQIQEYIKKLEDGELAMVSMLEDLRMSQQQIQELNKNLEYKVKQRTYEVEKLLRQKDEFIHMLGHDLKNPLTPLTTLLPILRKNLDDEKNAELLDVVIKNVHYIKNLVSNTLDLAQLNSPNTSFDLEDTDLLEQVNKSIDTNILTFKENNIEIINTVKENYMVKADKLRLNEVFNNLLSNAVKYSPSGGKIIIDADEKEDEIIISIKDNGVGIESDQKKQIFDEFYKADGSRHSFDSTGLGLPICKRIIEKHGGRIWVKSPGTGKGSTFYFILKKSK
jgi:PAS domain S-box-containing protein